MDKPLSLSLNRPAFSALVAISAEVQNDLLHTYRVARETQVRLIPLGFNLDRLLAIGAGERKRARESLNIPDEAVVVCTLTGHGLKDTDAVLNDRAKPIAAPPNKAAILSILERAR